MLAPRVEEEPCACLNHERESQGLRQAGDARDFSRQIVGERVEVRMVQREGAALVAQIGHDPKGIVEPVMGEAVGVVPVAERAIHALAKRRPST